MTIRGTNAAGDATALVDAVSIVQDGTTTTTPSTGLSDTGFEAAQITGTGSNDYVFDPTGTPWTFAATAGVLGQRLGVDHRQPERPAGVAGLVSVWPERGQPDGHQHGRGHLLDRPHDRPAHHSVATQTVQVWVDGTIVGSFTPTNYLLSGGPDPDVHGDRRRAPHLLPGRPVITPTQRTSSMR